METEAEITSEPAKDVFDHPKNITAGGARLIYAKACHPIGRDPLPEGWVVPGGARITDQWEAMAAAVRLDELMTIRTKS